MARLLIAVALASACSTPRTEVVIGVATDMPVGMVDQVKIDILREGVLTFDIPAWRIKGPSSGEYVLPASFGVYSDDGSEPKIEVLLHGRLGDTLNDVVLRRAIFS